MVFFSASVPPSCSVSETTIRSHWPASANSTSNRLPESSETLPAKLNVPIEWPGARSEPARSCVSGAQISPLPTRLMPLPIGSVPSVSSVPSTEICRRMARAPAVKERTPPDMMSRFSASSVPPVRRTADWPPIQTVPPAESRPPFSTSTAAVPPLTQSLRVGTSSSLCIQPPMKASCWTLTRALRAGDRQGAGRAVKAGNGQIPARRRGAVADCQCALAGDADPKAVGDLPERAGADELHGPRAPGSSPM